MFGIRGTEITETPSTQLFEACFEFYVENYQNWIDHILDVDPEFDYAMEELQIVRIYDPFNRDHSLLKQSLIAVVEDLMKDDGTVKWRNVFNSVPPQVHFYVDYYYEMNIKLDRQLRAGGFSMPY